MGANVTVFTRAFLATYRPLCRTATGRENISRKGLAPYVDGSCRREPDLEAEHPTITALCRKRAFAPRLKVGDRVVYVTKLGKYGDGPDHWRLTAMLRVIERFDTHASAASWFRSQGESLPRNVMVDGNPPLPWEQTDGEISRNLRLRSAGRSPEQVVRMWDAGYAERAREYGVVLVCDVEYRDLATPPAIHREDWNAWHGRIPGTRNPPQITEELWEHLRSKATSVPTRLEQF